MPLSQSRDLAFNQLGDLVNKAERDALICPRSDDLLTDHIVPPQEPAVTGAPDSTDPRLFGEPLPDPDPVPVNHSRLAICLADAEKLREWIFKQEIPIHRQVTAAHLVTALSGMIEADLRWICQAIKQAERAPAPSQMRRALVARDVAILRELEPV